MAEKSSSVDEREKNNEQLSKSESIMPQMSELNQASDHARAASVSIDLNHETQNETGQGQDSSVLTDCSVNKSSVNHEINLERTGSGVHEDFNEESTNKAITNLTNCQKCSPYEACCCCCSCQPSSDSVSQVWSLLHSTRSLLKLKDFRSEVRASMDVEQFVHQSELMLDLVEVSVEEIVMAMLKKVSSDGCYDIFERLSFIQAAGIVLEK